MENRAPKIMFFIIALSFCLNIYGLYWGLPQMWHPDEAAWNVVPALQMLRTRDFNPHFFVHPSFHLYLLGAIFAPYVLFLKLTGAIREAAPFIKDYPSFITVIFILGRLLSAILASATVYLIYLMTRKLYKNALAGVYSAAFLAVTMAFVNLAHFATTDITLIFLVVLSLYIALLIVEDASIAPRYYIIFGLVCGLAVSTKYNAVFIIIPAFLTLIFDAANSRGFKIKLLYRYIFNKKALALFASFAAGFLAGTPFSVLAFGAFLQDIIFQFFTRSGYKGFQDARPGYVMTLIHLYASGGALFFVLSVFGFIYGIWDAITAKRKSFWIIFSFIFIYGVSLCLNKVSALRYVVILLPFLNIFNGAALYAFLNIKYIPRFISCAIVLIIFVYSFLFSACACFKIKYDSRYAAGDWIKNNINSKAFIEVYDRPLGYLPDIPAFYKNAASVPVVYGAQSEVNPRDMEKIARIKTALKLKTSKSYSENKGDSISYADSLKIYYNSAALNKRNPQFIILSSGLYHRFLQHPEAYPDMTKYFNNLISEKENYKIAAKFKTKTILNADPEFINPEIIILKRN